MPFDVARLRREIAPAARGELAAQLLDLLLLLALLGVQLVDARGDLEAARLEQAAGLAELVLEAPDEVERARAGDRLDAAHALRDAALLGDLEQADVAGARTCVPPQNSIDSPIVTTRTLSPYFSPNIAIAPACLASAIGSTSVSAATFLRTRR